MNGASRGGYYGAATADRERCSRRGTSAFTDTRNYLGFRLNCGDLGGGFSQGAYLSRAGRRGDYKKNSVNVSIGFR